MANRLCKSCGCVLLEIHIIYGLYTNFNTFYWKVIFKQQEKEDGMHEVKVISIFEITYDKLYKWTRHETDMQSKN